MSTLFTLLWLISIVALLIGLIYPQIFSRLFKERATRKTIGLAFGGATILFFVLMGITTPDTTSTPAQSTNNAQLATPTPAPVATLTSEEKALAKKKADEAKAKQEADAKAQVDAKAKSEADAKAKQDAEDKANSVSAEYKSALIQATLYANTLYMSKKGVYDQLVSQYGGKFTAEAAQYGTDNVQADWNANALNQAKTYQDSLHLSTAGVHDQLVSQYGGKFTEAEADYAIQHLND